MACLEEHARLHHLRPDEAVYWLYVFAKNFHSQDDELDDDEPSASPAEIAPLLRALEHARGASTAELVCLIYLAVCLDL